jgi:hypothetical protein
MVVVRQLTSSDLGWFAEPRDQQLVSSKQRAINFNAAVVTSLLSQTLLKTGEVYLECKCVRAEALHQEKRILKKSGKNWRLGGTGVQGDVFLNAQPGDFFLGLIAADVGERYTMDWTVIFRNLDEATHASLTSTLSACFIDRMAVFLHPNPLFSFCNGLLNPGPQHETG